MSKYVIVSASHRPNSESGRIARHMNDHYFEGKADLIDLYEVDLPMWNGEREASASVTAVQTMLDAADGIVVVAPEWHGMAPAGLKNLFLWCN
ncbi:MAG: NAD(P)H-dependent oxidoreductase, partial [Oleibacter sp.]|nr:NAD(P)H-dependent oxidoreductase [Thalassolituus sp.]